MGGEKTSAQLPTQQRFTTLALVGSIGELLGVLRRWHGGQRIRLVEVRCRVIDGVPEVRVAPAESADRRARKAQLAQARQKRRIADGRCKTCGAGRNSYAAVCDACAIREREAQRKRTGTKPWKKGGVGRPPKVEKMY